MALMVSEGCCTYPKGSDLSHRLDPLYNHINANKAEYLPDIQETQPMKECTYRFYQIIKSQVKTQIENHGSYFEHTFYSSKTVLTQAVKLPNSLRGCEHTGIISIQHHSLEH